MLILNYVVSAPCSHDFKGFHKGKLISADISPLNLQRDISKMIRLRPSLNSFLKILKCGFHHVLVRGNKSQVYHFCSTEIAVQLQELRYSNKDYSNSGKKNCIVIILKHPSSEDICEDKCPFFLLQ